MLSMFLKAFKPQLWWLGGDLSCYWLRKSLLWEPTVIVPQLIQRYMKKNVEGYWVKLKLGSALSWNCCSREDSFSQVFAHFFTSFVMKKDTCFYIWRITCSEGLRVQWNISSCVMHLVLKPVWWFFSSTAGFICFTTPGAKSYMEVWQEALWP